MYQVLGSTDYIPTNMHSNAQFKVLRCKIEIKWWLSLLPTTNLTSGANLWKYVAIKYVEDGQYFKM